MKGCSDDHPHDAQQFVGRTAVDAEGSTVGKIGQVYFDDQTSQGRAAGSAWRRAGRLTT